MSNNFFGQASGEKQGGWERIFLDHSIGQGERNATVLQLRQFPTGTGFVRTINCAPGQLTVLVGDYETDSRQFRDALVGRPSPTPVTIRYGASEVSPSEIFSVGVFDHLSDDLTVAKTLERAHILSDSIKPLLAQAKLIGTESQLVRNLDESSRRQLSILAGLFSRTRFIFFDRPFATVTASAVEAMAEMMLKMAQTSNRIAIVTGVEKIPDVWKNSRDVQFSSQEPRDRKKSMTMRIQRDVEPEAVDSVRSMIQSNRVAPEQGDFIVTRPMIINPSGNRQSGGVRIQNERISNPHIAELVRGESSESPPAAPEQRNGSHGTARSKVKAPRDSARRKRMATGSLTRVSAWENILRKIFGQELLSSIRQIGKGAEREKQASGLPLATVAKSSGVQPPMPLWGFALVFAVILAIVMYFM